MKARIVRRSTTLHVEGMESRIVCDAGALDTSFNSTGKQDIAFSNQPENGAEAIAVDKSSGRIALVGNAGSEIDVAVLKSTGELDDSFGNHGIMTVTGSGGSGHASVAFDMNHNLVIACSSQTFRTAVWRVTPSGLLDTSFGTGGMTTIDFGSNSVTNAIAITPSGNIVVAGSAFSPTSIVTSFAIAELSTNGALNPNFGTSGKALYAFTANSADVINAIAPIDSSGTIILAGTHIGDVTMSAFAVIELNSDGSLHKQFASTGMQFYPNLPGSNADAVGVDGLGRIILAGPSLLTHEIVVARIMPTGGIDESFAKTGEYVVPNIDLVVGPAYETGVTVQKDGIIYVEASILDDKSDFGVLRVTSTGVLDNTFGTNGLTLVGFNPLQDAPTLYQGSPNAMTLAPDGNLLIAGSTTVANGSIASGKDFAVAKIQLSMSSSPSPTPTPIPIPSPTSTPIPSPTPTPTPLPIRPIIPISTPPPAKNPGKPGKPSRPTVHATVIQLTVNPKSAKAGKSITLSITVKALGKGGGIPTGTVLVTDGATTLGTLTLARGKAKVKILKLGVGKHSLQVHYAGDGNFKPSPIAHVGVTIKGVKATLAWGARIDPATHS